MYPSENELLYLGLTNSVVAQMIYNIISPTLNYSAGSVALLPVLFEEITLRKTRIDELAQENIDSVKKDWDSFETSWDLKKHPLI